MPIFGHFALLSIAEVGFEPTHPYGQGILSPQRLPFRHSAKAFGRTFELSEFRRDDRARFDAASKAPCHPYEAL